MDGEAGWWTTSGNIGLPPLARVMGVGRQQQGEVSDTFAIANGVKQGCVLAPTLFSIFLSAMLEEAFKDMGDGIYIQSRQNADFFTVSRST